MSLKQIRFTAEARAGFEKLVGQHDGDVVLRVCGQTVARRLVPRVELVEHEVEAGHALVVVLGRVVKVSSLLGVAHAHFIT